MPKEEKMVDLDTSGEGAEIDLKEKEQHETVVEDNNKSDDTPAESGEQLDAQENKDHGTRNNKRRTKTRRRQT